MMGSSMYRVIKAVASTWPAMLKLWASSDPTAKQSWKGNRMQEKDEYGI